MADYRVVDEYAGIKMGLGHRYKTFCLHRHSCATCLKENASIGSVDCTKCRNTDRCYWEPKK